ncbi:TRAP transporter solute receptor like protein [Vibrio phage RYC]|nr:TRAP transporter solute receptor like protein [Vibrio phage RYC]
MKKFILAGILSLATIGSVNAQSLMGTGGEDGTYYQMGSDIGQYCEMTKPQVSGGSVDNIESMIRKKMQVGFVQHDVLALYKDFVNPTKVNKKRFKIVAVLHDEPINILIPYGWQPVTNEKKSFWSRFGFGKDDAPKAIDLNLLKNQQVGAWGGSRFTAQALSKYAGLNLSVTEVSKNDVSGAMPVVVVAGAPSDVVQKFLDSGKYQLINVDYSKITGRATEYYYSHQVNYNVKGRILKVDTIATKAVLAGRNLRSNSEELTKLAECIQENMENLSEDSDSNTNWEDVMDWNSDEDNFVDWSYFVQQ